MNYKYYKRILFIISGSLLLLSLIPRFYDILKFLPDYKMDENEIVEFAVGFLGGDKDQRLYGYGPLLAHIMSLVYKVMSWFHEGNIHDFAQNVFFNNTQFYYTARFVNAIISLLTGYVVYLIVQKIWNRRIALLSLPLLIFPFSEYLVGFSVRVDTLLGLSHALSLFFMIRNFKKDRFVNYFLSAVFSGLGFACKPLPSVLIFPSIMLCLYYLNFKHHSAIEPVRGKKANRRTVPENKSITQTPLKIIKNILSNSKFYLYGIFVIISAGISFPHAFINWSTKGGFKEQQLNTISHEGGKEGIAGWRLDYYLGNLGLVFVILSTIGLVYGIYIGFKKKNYPLVATLFLPLTYILVFAGGPARSYWYAPIILFLIVGVIAVFVGLLDQIKRQKIGFTIVILSVLLIILKPTVDLVKRSLKYNSKKDYKELHTSLSAKKWIHENIPIGSKIALYGYYTSLPRLVSNNRNVQAQIGDYFMYYRGGNIYYTKLFVQAHQTYIQDPNNKVYDLTALLSYSNQQIYLRYKNEKLEPYLYQILKKNHVKYLVTTFKQNDDWDKALIMSFERPDYSFGKENYIYKIN